MRPSIETLSGQRHGYGQDLVTVARGLHGRQGSVCYSLYCTLVALAHRIFAFHSGHTQNLGVACPLIKVVSSSGRLV